MSANDKKSGSSKKENENHSEEEMINPSDTPLVDVSVESEESTEEANGQTGITKEFEIIQKELLYLRAEFDNYKKRILREQEQSIRFANEKLVREILAVVDHLERGVQHGKDLSERGQTTANDFVNFVNGMEMTQRELTQLLSRFGVELIGASGEVFDPAKHEAISQQEAPPEKQGTILQVLQKGCLLHGRLLTPARVVVAK